jgi:Questin oxidase-like
MAEALAQTCAHDSWIGNYLLPAEEKARSSTNKQPKSLAGLLDEIHGDKTLSSAANWSDGNKIRDGILARASEQMLSYASQYTVPPSASLEEKTAEMVNAASYFTACAQHPPNRIMFDFYYMHCVNASIFSSTFLAQDWLSDASKRRLLEWKGRMDLAMYASRHSPGLLLNEISNHKLTSSGKDAFERVRALPDDGHASKLVRAFAHGAVVCRPFEDKQEFRIKREHWEKLGDMVVDSVEGAGGEGNWVRSAGFEEAWEKVPKRESQL